MEYLLYYFKQLLSFSGKKLFIQFTSQIIMSLLQGVEIFLLIPVLSISGIMDTKTTSFLGIFGFLQNISSLLTLPVVLGIYLVLVISQSLLQRTMFRRGADLYQGFVRQLRLKIYREIILANWAFFIRKRKSDIVNAFTKELTRLVLGLSLVLAFLTSVVFTLIQIGLAFWFSPKVTFVVLIFGFLILLLNRKFVKKSNVLGELTSRLSADYLAYVTDQLNGIKEIKSNSLEQSRITWMGKLIREMEHEEKEYVNIRTNSVFLSKVVSSILIAVCIYFSVRILHAKPEYLLVIVVIFSRLWPRFSDLQASMEQIAASIPAFKAIWELEKECTEARELDREQQNDCKSYLRIAEGLECRNIYFRYDRKEPRYALQDICITIPAKQMTAVVGRSGAGKSTLIDILMGLVQPEKGAVLADGNPLTSENLIQLRQSISYVPQDPFLFNGSIKENLLLIKPDATNEELWEALELSASSEFVNKLPHTLDTLIGDRGIRLSGGERQRLVLARAILRKPAILILDEATSALDAENEKKIQRVLEKLKDEMTVIVVAHRLSTIRNADQVIVLDDGRVAQIGVFSQLALDKKGLFNNLLANQMGA